MIVVDTNIIAYLYLPNPLRESAVALLRADRAWRAPLLWRSEFRNVLGGYLRRADLALEAALSIYEAAVDLMRPGESAPPTGTVLGCVVASALTAYDCEFVSLAQSLCCRLITADRQILSAFPQQAVELRTYLNA
ncbi:MAG: type II toxin-antitoxin system VapC family toxin [Candidatus Eremiobacteraeota bacterium]|nr:type II toxin-antitoxin system VapC family toxin [Candidatus Eremiobacteraeota bacterium]MBC5804001.1 type II toxin-antitoxin system VapC family toxin [Candidatus Eremiobacteraeota bacterium]MBC5821008.1 type II toxin-antitoxin system VapC family toxin [Candidatus Eremiobacteraeota bacterium]